MKQRHFKAKSLWIFFQFLCLQRYPLYVEVSLLCFHSCIRNKLQNKPNYWERGCLNSWMHIWMTLSHSSSVYNIFPSTKLSLKCPLQENKRTLCTQFADVYEIMFIVWNDCICNHSVYHSVQSPGYVCSLLVPELSAASQLPKTLLSVCKSGSVYLALRPWHHIYEGSANVYSKKPFSFVLFNYKFHFFCLTFWEPVKLFIRIFRTGFSFFLEHQPQTFGSRLSAENTECLSVSKTSIL